MKSHFVKFIWVIAASSNGVLGLSTGTISFRDYSSLRPLSSSATVPVEVEEVMRAISVRASVATPPIAEETMNETSGNATANGNIRSMNLWDDQQRSAWIEMSSNDSGENGHSRRLGNDGNSTKATIPFHPFLVCNSRVGLSGARRRAIIGKDLYDSDGVSRIKPVFSEDDLSCFVVILKPAEIKKFVQSDDEIKAYPFTPLMKVKNWQQILDLLPVKQRNLSITVELFDNSTPSDVLNSVLDKVSGGDQSNSEATPIGDGYTAHLRRRQLFNDDDDNQTPLYLSCLETSLAIDSFFPELRSITFSVRKDSTLDNEANTACILSYIAALASHLSVYSMSVDSDPETFNDVAQQIVQMDSKNFEEVDWYSRSLSQRTPFSNAGLTGIGQVVGISDTGIKEESCYFSDGRPVERSVYLPGQLNGVVHDLSKRKIIQYALHPNADAGDTLQAHGTHTAGVLAGKREDEPGFGDGIAIDAQLAIMDIASSDGTLGIWPNEHLFLPAVSVGAFIHSMSWGYASSGYNAFTHSVDRWLYENDDQLIIVAAGNQGEKGENTLCMPATAFNVIAVGSSHSDGPDIGSFEEGVAYVASSSSRGPAGKRMKPDVVAPGHRLLSADGRSSSTGLCDRKDLAREDYLFRDGPSNGLRYASGTSMAAPVVAGAVSQIRQYFVDGFYPKGSKRSGPSIKPSGSLLKAVIMNGARSLKGVAGSSVTTVQPYDSIQGMGRVSLFHSLPLQEANDLHLQVFDRIAIQDADSHSYDIDIIQPVATEHCPLSATLVWTDEPGETLLNDIDLRVSLRGQISFPNGLNGPDRHNNVERVQLDDIKDGDKVKVKVRAHNLQADYVKYALVITYCKGRKKTPTVEPFSATPTRINTTPDPSPRPTLPPVPSTKPTTIQQWRRKERRRKRKAERKGNRQTLNL